MKKIHCNPEVPEGKRIERDLEDVEKEFYTDLLRALLDYISRYLLYAGILALGAWLAFYYIQCYAERAEREKSRG